MANKTNKRLKPSPAGSFGGLAMVAPRPAKPDLDLEAILQSVGNDRPYVVISIQENQIKVHFEGDAKPKTIEYDGDRWVIA